MSTDSEDSVLSSESFVFIYFSLFLKATVFVHIFCSFFFLSFSPQLGRLCVRLHANYCAIAFLAGFHGTTHDPAKNSAKTQISGTVHDPRYYSSLKIILVKCF